MKVSYLLVHCILAAGMSRASNDGDCSCLTDSEANGIIENYRIVYEGIPKNGTVETVEALARKTFAPDIKVHSQSLLLLEGYKGRLDQYPLLVDGFDSFRGQYDHVFTPFKVIASSHNCNTLTLVWEGYFNTDPTYGWQAGVDLIILKAGTKLVGEIYSEMNNLATTLGFGARLTSNQNATQCPPPA